MLAIDFPTSHDFVRFHVVFDDFVFRFNAFLLIRIKKTIGVNSIAREYPAPAQKHRTALKNTLCRRRSRSGHPTRDVHAGRDVVLRVHRTAEARARRRRTELWGVGRERLLPRAGGQTVRPRRTARRLRDGRARRTPGLPGVGPAERARPGRENVRGRRRQRSPAPFAVRPRQRVPVGRGRVSGGRARRSPGVLAVRPRERLPVARVGGQGRRLGRTRGVFATRPRLRSFAGLDDAVSMRSDAGARCVRRTPLNTAVRATTWCAAVPPRRTVTRTVCGARTITVARGSRPPPPPPPTPRSCPTESDGRVRWSTGVSAVPPRGAMSAGRAHCRGRRCGWSREVFAVRPRKRVS